jgi:hypothetical protein
MSEMGQSGRPGLAESRMAGFGSAGPKADAIARAGTIGGGALSPYENWQGLAWAGALLIATSVLALSLGARLYLKRKAAR